MASDQLDLLAPERPRPGRVRVKTLAETMLGMVAPGFGSERAIPKKLRADAEAIAERALSDLAAAVEADG